MSTPVRTPTMWRSAWAAALLLAAWAASPALAAVIFVNPAATGAGNGTSWLNAYTDLQPALLASVSGDEIWVKVGTYVPAPPNDAVSSFQLKSGVALYGGFAGSERDRAQRNWTANPTILSGDVGHDDTLVPAYPWYNGLSLNTANSGHVVNGSGVDASAIIDGFTITAGAYGPVGTPAGDPLLIGSGLYNVGGSPTVANCSFVRNLAAFGHGGAMYNYNSSPAITNCRFIENHVHLGAGGGIYNAGTSSPTINECTFTSNDCTGSSGGGEAQGAGISNVGTPPITVLRCTFENNLAWNAFGGIELPRGGGISCQADGLTVRDCTFKSNTAHAGGGIFTWGTATIVNCRFYSNTAVIQGAAIASQSFNPPKTTAIINCTIAVNQSGEGAVTTLWNHHTDIKNSILWGNTATGQQVSVRDAQYMDTADGATSVLYSCVQGLLDIIPGEDPPDPASFPGSIASNPLLVNIVGGADLKLSAASPCIDAAKNSYMPAGVVTDLAGQLRFINIPDVADTGSGTPPIIDMGAYERQLPALPGDVTGNGIVNIDDLLAVINAWGSCPAPPSACPADVAPPGGNAVVNVDDLLFVINHWS